MSVEIEQEIKAGQKMSVNDVRAIKIALNKLGFYTPDFNKGITGHTEDTFFEAIKNFQASQMLGATGRIFPDDKTIIKINFELKNSNNFMIFKRHYIWRTVGDKHVRGSHALRDGRQFSWDTSPDGGHPGEDFGCRCWAEPIIPMIQKGFVSKGRLTLPEKQQNSNFQLTSAGVLFRGAVFSLATCRGNSICRLWLAKQLGEVILESTYHPPPDDLEAFPEAKRAKRKGGRRRWKDSKGRIYEWDGQHGEVEVYDKTGEKHLGAFDSKTGKQIKTRKKGRTVEK